MGPRPGRGAPGDPTAGRHRRRRRPEPTTSSTATAPPSPPTRPAISTSCRGSRSRSCMAFCSPTWRCCPSASYPGWMRFFPVGDEMPVRAGSAAVGMAGRQAEEPLGSGDPGEGPASPSSHGLRVLAAVVGFGCTQTFDLAPGPLLSRPFAQLKDLGDESGRILDQLRPATYGGCVSAQRRSLHCHHCGRPDSRHRHAARGGRSPRLPVQRRRLEARRCAGVQRG